MVCSVPSANATRNAYGPTRWNDCTLWMAWMATALL